MPETHPRIKTRLDILFTSGREEGAGVLVEVSDSEALLEDTGTQPNSGANVTVYVSVPNAAESLKLVGKVCRHTERGFAVKFAETHSEIPVLISEATAAGTIPTDSREPAVSGNGRTEKMNLEALELANYDLSELERFTERVAAEIERRRGESKRRRLREEIHRLVQQEGLSLEEVLACGDDPQGRSKDES